MPHRTLAVCALVLLSAATIVSAQQPNSPQANLTVNGLSGPPYPVAAPGLPGTPVSLTLSGAPGAVRPFAIAASSRVVPGATVTGAGTIDLDLTACGARIVFNGFDPAHPLFALSVLGPASAPQLALTFGFPAATTALGGGQAIVADPTSPAGLTLSAAFDFFPAGPGLTSVSPPSGPQGGGNPVTLTGNGFLCQPVSVTFGGVPAGSAVVLDNTTVQCFAPPSTTTGPVDVTLVQDGQSVTLTGAYTYVPGNPVTTIIENFSTGAQRDTSFSPTFASARWADPTAAGVLTGTPIGGSPLATFNGNPANLGTRSQVNLPIGAGTSLPLTTTPFSGLFSPFDSAANNLGAGINPAGGSRIMHVFEAGDLGNPRASLELVEWGPTQDTVIAANYPSYQGWCGMTSTAAPIACQVAVPGLSSVYASNYSLPTTQAPDPANLNPGAGGIGGVRVNAPQTYPTSASFTSYFPYPVFDTPFDYIGSGPGAGNLLLEQDIAPHAQPINLHRFRATAILPMRRQIGPSGAATAAAGGCDIYDLRFTFVQVHSSARSNFYDSGILTGTPTYLGVNLSPTPGMQPAGTQTLLELEGATAIASPTLPIGPTSGWLTYVSGSPGSVVTDPTVLSNPGNPAAPQLTGNRYYRFRSTLRANHVTNALPSYTSLTSLVTF